MATKLTNDRDPVEVAADAIVNTATTVESLRDAIATALRTEATRAGEAMREAVKRIVSQQIGDNVDICGIPCPTLVDDVIAEIDALPLSDAPASPWPKDLDIDAAEATLSEVLGAYFYVMPADGMRRVIAAALRLPTPPAKDETA